MSSQVLQEGRILVEGQFKITFGTRARVSTILVYFYFNTGRCLILIDYYYVSRMKRNLIYISIKEPVIQYALSLYARQNVNISVLTAFFSCVEAFMLSFNFSIRLCYIFFTFSIISSIRISIWMRFYKLMIGGIIFFYLTRKVFSIVIHSTESFAF